MSGPQRVAVAVGSTGARIAVHTRRGPRMLAELPPPPSAGRGPGPAGAPAPGPGGVAGAVAVLAAVLDTPPAELTLVLDTPVPPATIRAAWPGVRAVTVPLAVAGAGPAVVVVDAGYAAVRVTAVRGGRCGPTRTLRCGGARLDEVVRGLVGGAAAEPGAARRLREALSLLPEVALRRPDGSAGALTAPVLRAALAPVLAPLVPVVRAAVAEAGGGFSRPRVVLVGGLARTPLLAELLDAGGVAGVQVAERPEAAAVLGALRAAPQPARGPVTGPGPEAVASGPGPEAVAYWPVLDEVPWAAGPRRGPLLPALPARGWRPAAGGLAAAAAVAALTALVVVAPRAGPDAPPPAPGVLVQYGYAVDLPAGWTHAGGLPERRRSLLTPADAPRGTDVVSVERTPLGYDADAEPARARAELRAEFDAAVRAGQPLTGFDPDGSFAGRPVVRYRQGGPAPADWFVLLDGGSQYSVGCRHTPARATAVRAACAVVVASVRPAG